MRRSFVPVLIVLCCSVAPGRALAAGAHTCPAGGPLATFKLTARQAGGGVAIPLSELNAITPGDVLVYEPIGSTSNQSKHASLAVIVIADDGATAPQVLKPHQVRHHAEWPVSVRAAAIGVVFGPDGIDEKKLRTLLVSNPAAIDQLTDYADETSKVEALVQALSKYEQSAPDSGGFQSALNGFSSQYGINLPALDRTKPVDQQATTLLRALTPALAPDASHPTLVQQSSGLAASVASLFFGPPAGLAIGGAALVGTLHSSLFPPSDFQSAFAQAMDNGTTALCTATTTRPAHGRIQFVWMLRPTNTEPPVSCQAVSAHIPDAWSSDVTVRCATVAQLRSLSHVRAWHLVSDGNSIAVPVSITTADANAVLKVDLKQVRVPPGTYRLAGLWDWTTLSVAGTIAVHPLATFSTVDISATSRDRLVAGSGTVDVQLAGADFEFLDRVGIASTAALNSLTSVDFRLPMGKGAGDQAAATAFLRTDGLTPGEYVLALTQVNGSRQDVPLTIHSPNPVLGSLPVTANVGEAHQTVILRGSGLEHIERLESRGATWALKPVAPTAHNLSQREADLQLDPSVRVGDHLGVDVFVKALVSPIQLCCAVDVLGPRPAITAAGTSVTDGLGVEVRSDELPADAPISFALHVRDVGPHPSVRLACVQDGFTLLTVNAGEKTAHAALDFVDQETLFLTVATGALGRTGCTLGATITNESTGTSDPYPLGTVLRLPHIDSFSVDVKKLGDGLYAGTLVGEGLETVEKTGWNASDGFAVRGLATPLPGQFGKETLDIAVPWPPPAPHAPLYIWLRGQPDGRVTAVTY